MKESNTNSAGAAASGATPGELLKAAREKQGLSVVDIASRLCLSVQFVEDIEHDDYSHMAARVYARGHVLSYAHLLGIPESRIIPALVNVNMHFAPVKTSVAAENEHSIPIYQPSSEGRPSRSNLLLWVSILVIIILIGLVVLWWKGPSSSDVRAPNSGAGKSTSVDIQPNQNTVPLSPPTAPGTAQPPAQALPPPASSDAPTVPPTVPAVKSVSPATTAAPNTTDQSVLQPSEFRDADNSADQSQAVALPPPTSTKPKRNQN